MVSLDDERLQNALKKFDKFNDALRNEAAHAFLINVLKLYSPESIQQNWQKSFVNEKEYEHADSLLHNLQKEENSHLLKIAVEETLAMNPETKDQFIESVENAGRKLWVMESGIVIIGVALLIREIYSKGKLKEKIVEEYGNDGKIVKKYKEIEYRSDGTLGKLLNVLGIGN